MKKILFFILIVPLLVLSCKKLDTYQQLHSISNASWHVDDVKDFNFHISDTGSEYHHYMVLRHDDNYHFSNIWMKILIRRPGEDAFTDSFLQEFILYDKNGYSYGEQQGTFWNFKLPVAHKRLLLTDSGDYTIRVQQIMREDQLHSIMNVGWTIEKK